MGTACKYRRECIGSAEVNISREKNKGSPFNARIVKNEAKVKAER